MRASPLSNFEGTPELEAKKVAGPAAGTRAQWPAAFGLGLGLGLIVTNTIDSKSFLNSSP